MKRITLFTLSLLSVLLVASCSSNDDNNQSDPQLQITPKTLEFNKDGGIKTFKVTVNDGNNFTAIKETTADWATISREGDVVTVTAIANTTTEARTVRIVVKTTSGGLQDHVSISQAGTTVGTPTLEVLPKTLEFKKDGESKTFKVTVNAGNDFTTTWETTDPGWATINRAGDVVTVTTIANTTTEARTARILVKTTSGELQEYVSISQAATTTSAYPFPYGLLTWGVNEAEIRAYEAANLKGVFNATNSSPVETEESDIVMVFDPATGDNEYLLRGYFFATANYIDYGTSLQVFKNLSRFVTFPTATTFEWTPEYAALLKAEGFTYRNAVSGYSVFTKPATTTGYTLSVYHKVTASYLEMQIFEEPVTKGLSSITAPRSLNKFFDGETLKHNGTKF